MFEGAEKLPEIRIPKGTVINRFSYRNEAKLPSNIYSTISDTDKDHYLVAWGKMRNLSGKTQLGPLPMQHLTFPATKEIKIPTLDETTKVMQETMNQSPLRKNVSLKRAQRELARYVGRDFPENFQTNMHAHGYGGIRDYMDTGVVGDNPVILFDHSALGTVSSKPITLSDLKAAENNLTELSARRGYPFVWPDETAGLLTT